MTQETYKKITNEIKELRKLHERCKKQYGATDEKTVALKKASDRIALLLDMVEDKPERKSKYGGTTPHLPLRLY